MNYKTKVLFLFGILLFGIGLSYFLGETFMEGFDTPAATTPVATKTTATTPAAATTPVATKTTATTPAATTSTADTTPSFASIAALASPMFASLASPVQKTYDNYNHYNDMTSTQYYGSTGSPINPITEDDEEVSSPEPEPNSSADTSAGKDYGTQYYSALPPGIPASQIIPGDEHLYILKSEIVPPVCPVCPSFSRRNKETPPPCPPCGRCPEASFECKKVPNYKAVNEDSMPIPVLNDFSSFGM